MMCAFDPLRTLAQVGWILVAGNDDLFRQPAHLQELVPGSTK
jgi:hypothetical protein